MSLNRNEKQTVVTDVAAQVARSQTLALAEYRGMTVEHLNALRKIAREKGVYLHVLKNTLARRAVAGTPFYMSGPQFEYWRHTHLTVDVVPGRGSGFSVEAPEGVRFLIRSRLFADDEDERARHEPVLLGPQHAG